MSMDNYGLTGFLNNEQQKLYIMSTEKQGFFANLKYDLPASIVVFLVAVPLCLGIALASGAPLFSGIIAGLVGGMVVTLFSGSPLGVSGPAAGLVAIVLPAIGELGFQAFLMAVVLCGVIQIILGMFRAGIIGYYFPTSVIKGMLAGIGVIIFLKQIPHAFGYDADPEGDFAFAQIDGQNTFSELVNMFDFITPGALIISIVSLAILLLWESKLMKGFSWTQWIQGPLVAVLSGIALGLAFNDTEFAISSNHMVSIPVASDWEGIKNLFTLPDFRAITNPTVYITAATLAVVASLETLLCVEATDKLDPFKRVTPTNRELRAQGIGNILSGLIGGLPVTQVIVRSSANIQSGGRSRASAFLHGVLILICALSIPSILNMIPLASLAAILLVVGFKLARPSLMKSMYDKGWYEFIPFAVTIIGIVFTDLLKGIGLGMIVAIFFILHRNFRIPFFIDNMNYTKGDTIKLILSEHVTFLNKAGIQRSLQKLPEGAHVILDATRTHDIHPDVLEIIDDFRETAHQKDITLDLIGVDVLMTRSPVADFEDMFVPAEQRSRRGGPFSS